jgi:Mg2+/Co2+ transporter CorB
MESILENDLAISVITIILLLMASAFFSGSETALTAASKARMRRRAKAGDKRAKRVDELMEKPERLLGGILLGNNLVNIMASAIATSVLMGLYGEQGVLYATGIMTAMVLVFAEVMPKTYAITNPDKAARAVGPIIGLVVKLFGPIVIFVEKIVRFTLNIFGVDTSNTKNILAAHEEIRGTIDLQAEEGGLRKAHKDMLESILDLDDVFVEDIMVHRKNMVMLDINMSPNDLVDAVIKSEFTRLPLYDADPENIIGVLHARDLLSGLKRKNMNVAHINVRHIMKEPWFQPETTPLRDQLNAFRERHAHFALVVDEYGALMGLVTLEDILEEIVGDISDEHDRIVEGITPNDDGSVLVDGQVTLRDLNRQFDWELPEDLAVTIAGLVLNESKTIPAVGERYTFFEMDFEIIGKKRNQITRIRINPHKALNYEKPLTINR